MATVCMERVRRGSGNIFVLYILRVECVTSSMGSVIKVVCASVIKVVCA